MELVVKYSADESRRQTSVDVHILLIGLHSEVNLKFFNHYCAPTQGGLRSGAVQ